MRHRSQHYLRISLAHGFFFILIFLVTVLVISFFVFLISSFYLSTTWLLVNFLMFCIAVLIPFLSFQLHSKMF